MVNVRRNLVLPIELVEMSSLVYFSKITLVFFLSSEYIITIRPMNVKLLFSKVLVQGLACIADNTL